jgi:hypothetical protein
VREVEKSESLPVPAKLEDGHVGMTVGSSVVIGSVVAGVVVVVDVGTSVVTDMASSLKVDTREKPNQSHNLILNL